MVFITEKYFYLILPFDAKLKIRILLFFCYLMQSCRLIRNIKFPSVVLLKFFLGFVWNKHQKLMSDILLS